MNNKTSLGLGLGGLGDASKTIRLLKAKSSASKEISTGDTLVEIDLNLIDYDKDQYRQDKQDYDLEGLAANIYEVGLTKLPCLEPLKNGRWMVTDGEMRTRAYILNREKYPDDVRFKKLPALSRKIEALPGLDQRGTRDVIQLSANLFSDPGSVFDIADKLSELEKKHGSGTVKKFMADMGQTHSKVEMSRWRSVAKVPHQVRKDVTANLIKDKETIGLLAKINQRDDAIYQQLIVDYQEDALTQSLAKSVKQAWKAVKAGDEIQQDDSSAPELAKDTTDKPKPNPPADLAAEQSNPTNVTAPADITPSSFDIVALKLEASGIELKGGELIITASHGQVFQIALPQSVEIFVSKRKGVIS
ncbi:MAG: hypothetical protein ACI9FJ_001025 [Alteromonadaceae bacterium]|jgi:hypothetical protein